MSEMREVLNHISEDFFKGPDSKDITNRKSAAEEAQIKRAKEDVQRVLKWGKENNGRTYTSEEKMTCPVCGNTELIIGENPSGVYGDQYDSLLDTYEEQYTCGVCGSSSVDVYQITYIVTELSHLGDKIVLTDESVNEDFFKGPDPDDVEKRKIESGALTSVQEKALKDILHVFHHPINYQYGVMEADKLDRDDFYRMKTLIGNAVLTLRTAGVEI